MSVVTPALPDVSQEIRDAFQKDIRVVQPQSNWASSLGHPCARFGVHRRVDWRSRPAHSVTSEFIFNGGRVIERYIAKDYLEKAGYEIVENNTPIQAEPTRTLEKLNIGGKLDFVCRKESLKFPVEVKSMAPYDWEKINSIEDFLHSKKTWHKTYPGQLTLYLLGRDYEIGMFLMINKLTYEPKHIWVHLDYTYAEGLLKRAEEINKHVADSTYPDRIEYDEQVCGKCDFASICLESIVRTEAEVLTDDSLIEKLERREELKAAKSEYEEIDAECKKALQGVKKGVAGNFMVIGEEVQRKGYTVEEKTIWQTSIKRLQ